MSKRPTFAAAKAALMDHLERAGWKVSRQLKVPHATHGWGSSSVRIWFKPQALYYSCGEGSSLNHARSLWVDVRDVPPEEIEGDALTACDPAYGGTSRFVRDAETSIRGARALKRGLERERRRDPASRGISPGCGCGRARDRARVSRRRRRPRYEIRGYAPSSRAKRGWICVRTTRQEFDDPGLAALPRKRELSRKSSRRPIT